MILLDTDILSLFTRGDPRVRQRVQALVTRNVRHFRLIPNLRVENWAE